MRRLAQTVVLATFLSGCQTYNYAEKVTLMSFSEDASPGKSVGTIKGTDCTWMVGGYTLGGPPTLRNAFMSAQSGKSGDAVERAMANDNGRDNSVRYINNVRTKNTGWNAVIIGKNCMEITGRGFK